MNKLTRIEGVPANDGKNAWAKTIHDITERINVLAERDEKLGPDVLLKMQVDLVEAQRALQEHEASLKSGMRSKLYDFNHLLPMIGARRIVPEDARANVDYYVLCTMTADELRFAADFRTLDDSPFQRTTRAAEQGYVLGGNARMLREFQETNDLLYLGDLTLCSRSEYFRLSPDPVERMKKGLPRTWARWEKIVEEMKRALSTGTATAGGNWIPTQLSARLAELIQPDLLVAQIFETVDMPNKSFDYPVLGADPVAFLQAEASSINQSDVVTNKTTFTAVKLACRTIASTEVLEDEAVGLEPILLRKISAAISRAIEDAILNGDTAITGGGTAAQDFDLQQAQNTGFANDRRGAWTGLRKMALVSNMPNIDLGSTNFTIPNLLRIRQGMKGGTGGNMFGLKASDLVWIVNLVGYIKILTAGEASQASALLTLEKYGAQATVFSGEVGQLCGSRIVLSEFQRDDVNANGVNASSASTFSTLNLVHRGGFALGRRRDITVQRSADHRFDTDEMEYTGTWRGHWRDLYPVAAAANRSVGIGRNFS